MTPVPQPTSPVFELPIVVAPGTIDVNGHVNNIVYLQWVQDAAVQHWYAKVDRADWRSILWVVRRHEIDYIKPAFAADELIARTWVEAPTAATWPRWVEIWRPRDAVRLAVARTTWCPLDPSTLRPRRIDEALRAIFLAER